MKQATRYVLILLVGILAGAGVTFERAVLADRAEAGSASGMGPLPFNQLKTFAEVFNTVKADYVFPVSNKKLITYAIRGMLSRLDPHSGYMDRRQFHDLEVDTEGRFGGLGLEVSMQRGMLVVVSPIDGSPAAHSGIKPGDVIIQINKQAVEGMTLGEAVHMMRGKAGSQITLTVVRKGTAKPLSFTLTRSVIHVPSVRGRMLAAGFGYLRISQFQSNTPANIRHQFADLVRENHGPLQGLVLDLRNNPGGVLTAAVSVADDFLQHGVIVSTKGRTPDANHAFRATPGDLLHGAPMIVLVNGGSASAAEIVSGALQDHHRALVVGTQTFGKGSVQTILPMPNGGALRLTTAQYYTPDGKSIQDVGITPNIVVHQGKFVRSGSGQLLLRETDLSGHLQNPDGIKPVKPKPGKPEYGSLDNDFQLQQALNLLKGIAMTEAAGHSHS
ncbi:MAG TPA: S41 family peptidase [Acidiferrobacteraceae bacterium]|nr:S41 family peptidase [Acidiferrobacteraceae bacterium]